MCSIFGLVRRGGIELSDRWTLRHLADQMTHRGPDGEGFHLSERAAIGMTRLAIIDLEGGWQPIFNEDRSVALVCNGEIYNYVELREDLRRRGHRFSTGSDCETIVHLYEEYGSDCVQHLRGMFAFALIDERAQRMLIARDRLGEKPLSIVDRPDSLVFCSEVVGLVGAGVVPFDVDEEAIRAFYHWNFLPDPMSAVRGVRKLGAATLMEIDLRSGERTERVYWRLADAPEIHDEPIERIRAELDTIARIIVRSDVPIGIGLSGGIDSSAIAAMAKRHATQPVTCFTIGYEGLTWQDERAMAQEFARHLDLPYQEMRLTTEQMVEDFPTVCLRRDDPLTDLSGSGFFALFRLSRSHSTPVLFSGHGGDELFWGYPWFRALPALNERKRRLRDGGGGLRDYLRFDRPPVSLSRGVDWLLGGAGVLKGLRDWKRDLRTDPWRMVYYDERPEFWWSEHRLSTIAGERLARASADQSRLFTGRALWDAPEISLTELMCQTFLGANGFILCDRLSMACSVEARVPLSDYRLAEVVVGLRKAHSDSRLPRKHWLKEALHEQVPDSVFNRRKRGFSPPWRRWMSALMQRFGADIEGGWLVSNGVLDRTGARRLRGGKDWLGRPLPFAFATLVLELWAQGMARAGANSPARMSARSHEPELTLSRHLSTTCHDVRA